MTDFLPGRAAVRVGVRALVLAGAFAHGDGWAQALDVTPSRRSLDDAAKDNCEGVSVVVQRCGQKVQAAPPVAPPGGDDALARSRAAAKAAFDRRDRRARDEALSDTAPEGDAPGGEAGDAQRLGRVTVTGQAPEQPLSPEQNLQRSLAPKAPAVGPTVVHYGPNGTRTECIEKCVGPACCIELRSIPNPARDLNMIGR